MNITPRKKTDVADALQQTAEWDRGATPTVWAELDRCRASLAEAHQALGAERARLGAIATIVHEWNTLPGSNDRAALGAIYEVLYLAGRLEGQPNAPKAPQ